MRLILWSLAIVATVAVSVSAQQPVARPSPAAELGSNLPAQALGPNDLIGLSVYEAPELSRSIRVGADGYISISMLKQKVKANGLLPTQLEAAIAEALVRENILVDPHVTVTIAEYQSRPISVTGAVRMPVVFQAEGRPVTLLEAIARAQGLREDAGAEILICNTQSDAEGKPQLLIRRIIARDLFGARDPSLNIRLYGGEEIRVPEVGKIFVVGNVKKPGAFPVQGGNETTVLQMLALAEGLEKFASDQAYIYRREAAGSKNEIPIELKKILDRKSPDVPLVANDILYVPDNSGKRRGASAIERILLFSTTAGAIALGYAAWR